MKRLLLLFVVVFAFAYKTPPVVNYIKTLPKQSLSNQEIRDLMHMREEEKLARDVYKALYKRWGLRIFNNISKSEQWHMDMIKLILDKYNLPDPVAKVKDKEGVFTDTKLQNLYHKLVTQGSRSIKDALIVGATIEDLDIKDLEEAIKRTDNKDIKIVYSNLKHGSENHLRAFVGLLRKYGGDYKPQFISQAEFNKVLSQKKQRNLKRFYVISGKVIRVYQLPGLVKNVKWWMIDVVSNNGVIRVAVVPTYIMPKIDIRVGDRVRIRGFNGKYSFITCALYDINTKFSYRSYARYCK